MLSFRDTPIQTKLTRLMLLITAIALLVTVSVFIAYEVVIYRQSSVQELTTVAEVIGRNSTAALSFDDPEDAIQFLEALRATPHIVAARIFKGTARFAAYPEGLPDTDGPRQPAGEGYRFVDGHLELIRPIVLDQARIGFIYVKANLDAMYGRLQLYGVIAGLMFLISMLVAYALARSFQSRISVPLLELAKTAQVITERRDFSVRARKFGRDEFGLLTDAFNEMLAEIHALNTKLEQRVRDRTADLESANREMEAFTYTVSHDLRAPLRHIDGYAEILGEAMGKPSDPEAVECLQKIRRSARHLGKLVDDLLNFSRLGRSELVRLPVQLTALAQEEINRLRPETQHRQVEWKLDPLPEADCDPGLMQQVFANLLSNAVKYTRSREKAVIEITQQAQNGEPVICVRDNGVGFNMKYSGKLFGVFQRLHRAEEFEGTGVGLASVERIIRKHGGRIWAEADVGKGAAFYFTIPGLKNPGRE